MEVTPSGLRFRIRGQISGMVDHFQRHFWRHPSYCRAILFFFFFSDMKGPLYLITVGNMSG